MRVSLFLDGANLFYMQRDCLRWWTDPKKILDFVRTKCELVDAFYYMGVDAPSEATQEYYLYWEHPKCAKTLIALIP
jgi:predicted membrane-bound dolichyl-phosphate-mannose-protein mannosyltransferase